MTDHVSCDSSVSSVQRGESRETESGSVVAWRWGGVKGWGLKARRSGASRWGDENVPQIDGVMAAQLCQKSKNH